MDKKELFRAIDACEDRFIREAAEDIQKRKPSMIRRFFFVNSSENTEENSEKDVRKLSGLRGCCRNCNLCCSAKYWSTDCSQSFYCFS